LISAFNNECAFLRVVNVLQDRQLLRRLVVVSAPPREETTPRGAVVETAHKVAETLARQTIMTTELGTFQSPPACGLVSFPGTTFVGSNRGQQPLLTSVPGTVCRVEVGVRMTEARLFTNVRTAWVWSMGASRPVFVEIDALWTEVGYKVIGFAAKNGRVDTFRGVFEVDLECDPLEHEFTLHEPPKPQLAYAELSFVDGTRVRLQVRDRQRPVDVLDATEDGDIYRNKLWEMMSAKVREYPVDMK
jgi:hypothetical protein